jgi:hypothetical protein
MMIRLVGGWKLGKRKMKMMLAKILRLVGGKEDQVLALI